MHDSAAQMHSSISTGTMQRLYKMCAERLLQGNRLVQIGVPWSYRLRDGRAIRHEHDLVEDSKIVAPKFPQIQIGDGPGVIKSPLDRCTRNRIIGRRRNSFFVDWNNRPHLLTSARSMRVAGFCFWGRRRGRVTHAKARSRGEGTRQDMAHSWTALRGLRAFA